MLKKLILLLIGWVIIGSFPGQAQDLDEAITLREANVSAEKKIPLKKQLKILEEEYQATFMYQSHLIEDKNVAPVKGQGSKLSKALHKVLKPFQLTYDQIGDRSFIILQAKTEEFLNDEEVTGTVKIGRAHV